MSIPQNVYCYLKVYLTINYVGCIIISMKIKKIVEQECLRCHHIWLPRHKDVRQCPGCHSVLWDVPKKVEEIKELK